MSAILQALKFILVFSSGKREELKDSRDAECAIREAKRRVKNQQDHGMKLVMLDGEREVVIWTSEKYLIKIEGGV